MGFGIFFQIGTKIPFVFCLLVTIEFLSRVSAQVVGLGPCPNLRPMEDFHMDKFLGRWVEVSKYFLTIEALTSCPEEFLYQKPDGTYVKEITLPQLWRKRPYLVEGDLNLRKERTADFVLTNFHCKTCDLVSPDQQFNSVQIPYKVLNTDYKSYLIEFSCYEVGPLNFQQIWVLTRNGGYSKKQKRQVLSILTSLGVNTELLIDSAFECNRKRL